MICLCEGWELYQCKTVADVPIKLVQIWIALVGKFVLSAKILTLWLPFDVLWGGSNESTQQFAMFV